jgi:hypothetical protein
VDGNPSNNAAEQRILEDLGIVVRRALNTTEALSTIASFQPDVIISNVVRDGDISEPLHNCPAHYFDVPNGVSLSLPAINEATISGHGRATGFAMAEEIYDRFPALANHEQPRIIFYSASNGSVVTSQCARVVTNRTDVLLQNVVSLLEELHWPSLSINGALADRSSSSNP